MHVCAAGKPTLANPTAELMHALGLLPTDTVVLKSVPQLVARYVHPSRAIVAQAFESANSGVLFMNEADTLAAGGVFCRGVLHCLIAHVPSPTHQARASISQQPISRTLHTLTNAIASSRTRRWPSWRDDPKRCSN
jgi:hypothetical protein